MSSLIADQTIDVVKITFSEKDGGTSKTYYFGTEYFEEGEIYSGSPVVYPLLTSVPITRQKVERVLGSRMSSNVTLFGKMPFDEDEDFLTLFDLQKHYEYFASAVEFRKYWKPSSNQTSHVDATNIREKLQIVSHFWDGDILTFSCRDTFFDDKPITKNFNPNDHPHADPRIFGLAQPLAFGKSGSDADEPVIPAYWVNNQTNNTGAATTAEGTLHAGYVPGDLKMGGYNTVYVENRRDQDVISDKWVKVALGADSSESVYAGVSIGSYASGTAVSLSDRDYGGVLDLENETEGRIITSMGFMYDQIPGSDTPVQVTLAYCRYDSARGWLPFKTIFTEKFDIEGSSNGAFRIFVFEEPLILLPGTIPYLRIHWPDFDTAGGDPKCYYGTTAGTFEQSQAVEADPVQRREHGFVTNSSGPLQWTLFQAYKESYDDGASSDYASLKLKCDARHGVSGASNKVIKWETLNVKLGVDGVEDTTAGTYTDSGDIVVQNPANLILGLLRDDQGLGVGLSSDAVDHTTMKGSGSVEEDLSDLGDGYDQMSVAIEREVKTGAIISEIAKQSRIILYKSREGKQSLHFPQFFDGVSPTHYLRESALGCDLEVLSDNSGATEAIVNEISVNYDHDPLSTSKEIEQRLRSKSNAYNKTAFISASDSSSNNGTLQQIASDSKALYGLLPFKENWFWTAASGAAEGTAKYILNRYARKQRKPTVRVANEAFNGVKVFDTIKVSHRELASSKGSIEDVKIHQSGKGLTCYSKGNICKIHSGGTVKGFVAAISEDGEHSDITIETQSAF